MKGPKRIWLKTEDEAGWITVHPNGPGTKGTPVKIDKETGEVLAGLGGKFTGRHISALPKGGRKEQHGAQAVIERKRYAEAKKKLAESKKPPRPSKKLNEEILSRIKERAIREDSDAKFMQKIKLRPLVASIPNETFFNPAKRLKKIADLAEFVNSRIAGVNSFKEEIAKDHGASESDFKELSEAASQYETMKNQLLDAKKKALDILAKRKAEHQKTGLYPQNLAGTKRGKEMSIDDAAGKGWPPASNPHFAKNALYRRNCQTCVVAMEARLRGYDVIATAGTELNTQLSYDTSLAWIDPKTGEFADDITLPPGTTKRNLIDRISKATKDGERYTIEWEWKGGRSGHIVSLFRSENGFKVVDPQTGQRYDENEFLDHVTSVGVTMKSFILRRIDDKVFYSEIRDKILEENKHE